MAGSKHYSDLTAVKSAFISALLWANTVGNMNKTQAKKKKNRTQPDAVAGNMSECLSPCVPDSLAKREETEKKYH